MFTLFIKYFVRLFLRNKKITKQSWRESTEYYRWTKSVRRTYNNRCAVTGKRKHLHCHHLNNAANYPNQRFDVSNGILLHKDVHKKFHMHMGGYHIETTRRDWENFIRTHSYLKKEHSSFFELLHTLIDIVVYGTISIGLFTLFMLLIINFK